MLKLKTLANSNNSKRKRKKEKEKEKEKQICFSYFLDLVCESLSKVKVIV